MIRKACSAHEKPPGMVNMPGESQEEPSVMVAAISAAIRITSNFEM